MKKSNAIVAILCATALSVTSFQIRANATGDTSVTYNSKGIIEYDDDKDGNAEIIFNAGDFKKIDATVTAGKNKIANAITGLTGETLANTDFSTLADAIASIPNDMSQNGDFGDVTANYVLKDKTFTSSAGVKQSGTMPNNGAVNKTLDAGATYTIPAGYHNGSGKITVKNSSTTASAGDILTGKSVTINGTTTNGTMANKGGTTTAATSVTESGTNALITIPANGYYTTSSKISVPVETIKNNVSSLNSSLIVDALQNKSTEFNSLSSDSSCPEIATAIENSNLTNLNFTLRTGEITITGSSAYGSGEIILDNSKGLYKKVTFSTPSNARELHLNDTTLSVFSGSYDVSGVDEIKIVLVSQLNALATIDVNVTS